jgi:hypothetical protein
MAPTRVMAYSAEGGGYLGKWCPADYHECPSWAGGWNGNAFETLFMAKGKGKRGSALWYLYCHVEPPMLEDFGHGNIVDHASYVMRLTDDLARRWFEGKSLKLPDRLMQREGGEKAAGKALTPRQRKIMDALKGCLLTADALAQEVGCARSTLFKKGGVNELMACGRVHNDGHGYYRPDAPPMGLTLPVG